MNCMDLMILCLIVPTASVCAQQLPSPAPLPESTLEISFVDPDQIPTSTFTDPVMREAEANYQLYGGPMSSERIRLK